MKKVPTRTSLQRVGKRLHSGTTLTHVITMAFVVALAMTVSSCALVQCDITESKLGYERIMPQKDKEEAIPEEKALNAAAWKAKALKAAEWAEEAQKVAIPAIKDADAETRIGTLWECPALRKAPPVIADWKEAAWNAKDSAIKWKIAAKKEQQEAKAQGKTQEEKVLAVDIKEAEVLEETQTAAIMNAEKEIDRIKTRLSTRPERISKITAVWTGLITFILKITST